MEVFFSLINDLLLTSQLLFLVLFCCGSVLVLHHAGLPRALIHSCGQYRKAANASQQGQTLSPHGNVQLPSPPLYEPAGGFWREVICCSYP